MPARYPEPSKAGELAANIPSADEDLTDPRLCAAIVDRLTLAGPIIETSTATYRLADTRGQRSVKKHPCGRVARDRPGLVHDKMSALTGETCDPAVAY
jgi:hypothetical protein